MCLKLFILFYWVGISDCMERERCKQRRLVSFWAVERFVLFFTWYLIGSHFFLSLLAGKF